MMIEISSNLIYLFLLPITVLVLSIIALTFANSSKKYTHPVFFIVPILLFIICFVCSVTGGLQYFLKIRYYEQFDSTWKELIYNLDGTCFGNAVEIPSEKYKNKAMINLEYWEKTNPNIRKLNEQEFEIFRYLVPCTDISSYVAEKYVIVQTSIKPKGYERFK